MSGHYEYRNVYRPKDEVPVSRAFWVEDVLKVPKPPVVPVPPKPPAVPKPSVFLADLRNKRIALEMEYGRRAELAAAAASAKAMVVANANALRAKGGLRFAAANDIAPQWSTDTWAKKQAADSVAARKVVELTAQRKASFNALASRNKAIMFEMDTARRQVNSEGAAAAAAAQQVDAEAMAKANLNRPFLYTAETWAAKNTADILAKTNASGDYVSALTTLRDQQLATGGRYWDSGTYNQIYTAMMVDSNRVSTALQAILALGARLTAARDWPALTKLTTSASYLNSVAEYVKWFGDGKGQKGIVDSTGALMEDIAAVNQNYLERTVAAQYGGRKDGTQADTLQSQIDMMQLSKQYEVNKDTGEWTKVPISMADYVKGLEDKYQAEAQAQGVKSQEAQGQAYRALISQGFTVDANGVAHNVRQDAAMAVLKAGSQGKNIDALVATARGEGANGASVSQVARTNAQRDLDTMYMDAWDKKRPMGREPVNAKAKWKADRAAARNQFSQVMFGQDAEGAGYGGFGDLMSVPVLGEFMKFAGVPSAAVSSVLRVGGAALGGEIKLPDIDLPALLSGKLDRFVAKANPFNIDNWGVDKSPAAQARQKAAIDEFTTVIQEYSKDGDWGKLLQAFSTYGMEPTGSGLANVVGPALWDPTTFLSLGKFAKSAGLAVERSAGKSMVERPGSVLSDLYKMQAWKGMPGKRLGLGENFSASTVTKMRETANFNKIMGTAFKEVPAGEWDAYFRVIAEKGVASKEAASVLKTLVKGRDINPDHLLNVSQAALASIAAKKGVVLTDAVAMHKLAAEGERLAEKARVGQKAVLLAESRKVGAVANQVAYRAAFKGKGAAEGFGRIELVGAQAKTRKALAGAVTGILSARQKVAEQARSAARVAMTVGVKPGDNAIRSVALKDLRTSLKKLAKFDEERVAKDGSVLPSLVTTRVEALREFDSMASYGVRHGDRPSQDVVNRLVGEGAYLNLQIGQFRQRLAGVQGSARPVFQAKLDELVAARRFVLSEQRVAAGQATTAEHVVARYGSRVTDTFKSSRVALKVKSAAEARVNAGREYNVALRSSEATGPEVVALGESAAKYGRWQEAMSGKSITVMRDPPPVPRQEQDMWGGLDQMGGSAPVAKAVRVDSAAVVTAKAGVVSAKEDLAKLMGLRGKVSLNSEAFSKWKSAEADKLRYVVSDAERALKRAETAEIRRVREEAAALLRVPVEVSVVLDLKSRVLAPYARMLEGVDFETALLAFTEASAISKGRKYADAIRYLEAQVKMVDPDFSAVAFADLAKRSDFAAYAAEGMSKKEFLGLESKVRKAIVDAKGGATRKGTLSVSVGKRSDNPKAFVRADAGLSEILAKFKVLKSEGRGIWAYDEARTVLWDAEARRGTSMSFAAKAAASAKVGGTFDEHWASLMAERVPLEGKLALERYAAQPRYEGWGVDEIWTAFQEEHLAADYVPGLVARTPFQMRTLERAVGDSLGGVKVGDVEGMKAALAVGAPSFTNRADAVKFLEDTGRWARKTAEDVRSSGRVWPVVDEREFWISHFGKEPEWTAEAELLRIRDDPELYAEYMRKHGFFGVIEEASLVRKLSYSGDLKKAVATGLDGDIKKGRTWAELRSWYVERFGKIASEDGGKTMLGFIQVMDPFNPEYKAFSRRVGEKQFPAGFLRPGPEVEAFGRAVDKAIDWRMGRLVKNGVLKEGDEWMPEEQFLFALDVANELMLTKAWHNGGMLKRFREYGLGGSMMGLFGYVMRMTVAWNPAFAFMNLADRFVVRPWLLVMANSDARFIGKLKHTVLYDRIRVVEDLGEHAQGIMDVRGMSGRQILMDKSLPMSVRLKSGGLKMIAEAPFSISSIGENRQKIWFARHMADKFYDDLLKEGMAEDVALELAINRTKERVRHFFPTMEHASEGERLINDFIPFFSYNMRNNLLGLEIVATNPWIWSMADRLRTEVIKQNVAQWNEDHPGEPWPESWDRGGFTITLGGQVYQVDLSNLSDWFRGPNKLFGANAPTNAAAMVSLFVRVPHPSQVAFLTWLFGTRDPVTGKLPDTPWGKEATLSQWFFPADLWEDLQHLGTGDSKSLDLVQFGSKYLFYTEFAKLDVNTAASQWWFSLRDAGRYTEADAYYLAHKGQIDVWLGLHTTTNELSPIDNNFNAMWRTLSFDEQQAYQDALTGLTALRAAFDDRLTDYTGQPWAPEAQALRLERRAAIARYYLDHPELLESGQLLLSGDEWAQQLEDWAVDDSVDYYMAWGDNHEEPTLADYTSEVTYLEALKVYNADKEQWLVAHPEVSLRLASEWAAVSGAWHDQTQHWSELIDQQIDLRIATAKEEAKGAAADRNLISALYDFGDTVGLELDAEAFAPLYSAVRLNEKGLRTPLAGWRSGRLITATVMPGLSAYTYLKADPATRKKMDADTAYVSGIKTIVKKATSGKQFYDLLLANPTLAKEYWARNPAKYQTWLTGNEYVKYIGRWGSLAAAGRYADATAAWEQLPSWVKDRYYASHPGAREKAVQTAAYIGAMEQYGAALYAKQYVQADAFFAKLPEWMKQRYFAAHPGTGAGGTWDTTQGTGQYAAYGAAMEKYGAALYAKQYDQAKALFAKLPVWMQERYYAAHPDARYTYEMENGLYAAAEGYFLADEVGRADILAKNPRFAAFLAQFGGTEAQRRGMVVALYAMIPKDNAWMKRTFRLRYPEIFSQETVGQAKLMLDAKRMALHPELIPAKEKWLASQRSLYATNLKSTKVAPRQLSMVRLARYVKVKRDRSARFDDHWTKHRRLRVP